MNNSSSPVFSTGKQNDRGQYIRCPIPPIAINAPDNLRQFYNGGTVPQYRFQMTQASLPSNNVIGASSETVNVVASSSSGSSGGGGISTNGIFSASITTPNLNPNQNYSGTIVLSKTYIVLNVSVSAAARIRLYVSSSFATSDLARNVSTPVSLGLMNGIVGDWLLQSASEFNWNCSPAPVGYNADQPTDSAAYIVVTNPAASSNPIKVTLTYASLES